MNCRVSLLQAVDTAQLYLSTVLSHLRVPPQIRLARALTTFRLAQYTKGLVRRISILLILCRYDGVPSRGATIFVSPAELNTILILHISPTRRQLCYYILLLHTSKSSTPLSLASTAGRQSDIEPPAVSGPRERPPATGATRGASTFATGRKSSEPVPHPLLFSPSSSSSSSGAPTSVASADYDWE